MYFQTSSILVLLLAASPLGTMAGKSKGGNGKGGHGGGSKNTTSALAVDYVNITCADDYICGHGVYVCRTSFDVITAEETSDYKCIDTDKAWSTDVCGCCGEECPEYREEVEFYCDASAEDSRRTLRGGGSKGGNKKGGGHFVDNKVYLCRSLYDPYTGESTSVTVIGKNGTALEGDTCGCCDDVCPEDGDSQFEEPELVDATCDAPIACNMTKNHHHKGDDTVEEGLYVCRTSYNTLTGEDFQKSLCVVPSNSTYETDTCGCCGDSCPGDDDDDVTIECTEEDVCEDNRGNEGVYVCRTMYNPQTGVEVTSSECISADRALSTDTCGCCDDACTENFRF
eukprot:Nitzschia sp. Nitz4//scaffold133_size116822//84569//85588//NITZ4_003815-RA/size116822-est2genome-gene-0.81-mRNA-1//1//CDS//3329535420//2173//frame0